MSASADSEIREKVLKSLSKIRPYLQADGGDVELMELTENKTVKIRLQGTCNHCPYHMQTSAGVEQAILNDVPEITKVIILQKG